MGGGKKCPSAICATGGLGVAGGDGKKNPSACNLRDSGGLKWQAKVVATRKAPLLEEGLVWQAGGGRWTVVACREVVVARKPPSIVEITSRGVGGRHRSCGGSCGGR